MTAPSSSRRRSRSTAYGDLLAFGKPVFTTQEAADRLRSSLPTTSRTLRRLAADGLARKLAHGLWSLSAQIEPFRLVEALTAPYPGYVSLQSALYLHGMVSQIPQITYVVSLAPTARIETTVGAFSIHQIVPELFFGFAPEPRTGVALATPEKALFDFVYLSRGRSRLFARLPEIELPPTFRARSAEPWFARIASPPLRAMAERRWREAIAAAAA